MTERGFETDQGETLGEEVRVEVDSSTDISMVLAYRVDGELVELAERSAPAVATISGTLPTDADDRLQ